MIVLLEAIYLLGKYIYRRYYNNRHEEDRMENEEDENGAGASYIPGTLKRRYSNDSSPEESKPTIKFSPPAYIQRHQAVFDVLNSPRYEGKLKKVVDFGCSELQFCMYLKTLTGIEEALFVDIDENTLSMYKRRAKPLHVDHIHRRTTPLVLRVLEGSVTDPDKHLENVDAVVAIELIEHLYPETLREVPQNIFGFIKPKVAIFTTPNADFNVLFDRMTGFRHPDHKFEWTRKEFQDWAHSIVARFPEYEVSFQGICYGPPGTENLGACSQMAVFHKICDLNLFKSPGIEGLYKPVEEYEYPIDIDNRSDEQKILDDAIYYMHQYSWLDDIMHEEVPLNYLLEATSKHSITLDHLKEILVNANYTIVDRENGPHVVVAAPSSSASEGGHSWSGFLEEDDFDEDHEYWGVDPGPPVGYRFNRSFDVDVVDEEDWENEPHIDGTIQPENQSNGRDTVEGRNWENEPDIVGTIPENQNNGWEGSSWENEPDIVGTIQPENPSNGRDIVEGSNWENEPDIVGTIPENQNNGWEESSWENEPDIVGTTQPENRSNGWDMEEGKNWESWKEEEITAPIVQPEQQNIESNNFDNAAANNSTASIQPDDVCLDDIITESRSTELVNSTLDSSIEISSFSGTKGSDNSDTATIPCQEAQESLICIDKKISKISSSNSQTAENITLTHTDNQDTVNDTNNSSYKTTSICSMFLEPSRMSEHAHLDSIDQFSDSTMTSPVNTGSSKKLQLENSVFLNNMDDKIFEEPRFTSSPHISSTFVCKRRKSAEDHAAISSVNEDSSCTNDKSKSTNDKSDNPSTCSNESVIGESNGCSPQINYSETPEQVRIYTGTIPKVISSKLSNKKVSSQKDLKLERISPSTPESLLNSWSPEIMDSGYPNSNSPPDLSPIDDLSSIAHDHLSDAESPSVADVPRFGFFDMAENRDLANNNLDGEGNYLQPEEDYARIRDMRPLINVLEHDLENENDIYVARHNDFPVWLLRLLQRFDADGVGINLPMPQPPNENFGDQ